MKNTRWPLHLIYYRVPDRSLIRYPQSIQENHKHLSLCRSAPMNPLSRSHLHECLPYNLFIVRTFLLPTIPLGFYFGDGDGGGSYFF